MSVQMHVTRSPDGPIAAARRSSSNSQQPGSGIGETGVRHASAAVGRNAGATPAGSRRSWSLVTCLEDGHSHAVPDPVLAEGGVDSGRFPAR